MYICISVYMYLGIYIYVRVLLENSDLLPRKVASHSKNVDMPKACTYMFFRYDKYC